MAAEELGPVDGHEDAKRLWLDAISAGRLHHGWLLRGPRGVGKARLALQFAASLLGASGANALSVGPDDAVGRLIASGSHPDLRVIRRPVDEKGKEKSEIPVDSVRELASFFALRPAMGGWRVAIVDAVDELNRFGANAVLKTLEEPPGRAVIILISHGERALLPTIRSRCRTVRLDRLNDEETMHALEGAGLSAGEARRAAALAPGRPGRAVSLIASDAPAAIDALIRAAAPRAGPAELQAAMMHGGKSEYALTAAIDVLRRHIETKATSEADPLRAADLAATAIELGRLGQEAVLLNQDRAQTIASAVGLVRARKAG